MKMNKNQQGFTLTEILVALVLGLFLTGVVITIFASSQNTFRATSEVSRSQENTRFALSFLGRNIRLAGYTNCSDDIAKRNFLDLSNQGYIPSMEHTVFGWEFGGTGVGETYTLDYESLDGDFTAAEVNTARANNTTVAGAWNSQFIQSVINVPPTDVDLPATIAGFEPLVGSDIIAVSISTPLDIFVADQFSVTNPVLQVVDTDGLSTQSGVDQGQLLKLADCSSVDLFQNAANATDTFIQLGDGAGVPDNDFSAASQWQKPWGQFGNIFSVDTSVFFVGTGAGGRPSLYQYTTACGIDAGCGATAVELVEGVENMQVMYGQDTNGDGVANSYVTADAVTNYGRVKSVKIGLLMRSPDIGPTEVDTSLTHTLLDTVTVDPPDDRYLRYISNSTVYLRNTGL